MIILDTLYTFVINRRIKSSSEDSRFREIKQGEEKNGSRERERERESEKKKEYAEAEDSEIWNACKFIFNFVTDTEAAAERNFRTGILACAGNKPSTSRTGNFVERNDARCCLGFAIDGQPRCILYSKKRNTAVEKKRERERMEKGIG